MNSYETCFKAESAVTKKIASEYHSYLLLFTFFAVFMMMASCKSASSEKELPNIVIIFADDMGYGDPGFNGGKNLTPNLDDMARQGMVFTDFYVAQPVCGASRAALLTGCYPNRISIHGAPGPNTKWGINDNELTIAELLKQKGYATGMYGKWHLGHHRQFLPVHHGFDDYFGTPYSNDMWPKHPDYILFPDDVAKRKRGYPPLPLIEDDTVALAEVTEEDQAMFTTWFTERAVDFIVENKQKPFFLYLAHPMPHVPIYASEKYLGKSGMGLYADVIMEIDWSVGRINRVLDSLDLAENTLVIFTSDNGPWLSYGNHAGSAGPLREGKGTVWDGGVREPCVMKWPARITEGSRCTEPAMTIDILPTLADITGAPLSGNKIDGKSILPLLLEEKGAASPQEAYYFYYGNNELRAIRSGDWKMHYPHRYRTMEGQEPGKDGMPGWYTHDTTSYELYNLKQDIGEMIDLSDKYPEIMERMKTLGDSIIIELGNREIIGHEVREPGWFKQRSLPE